MNWKRTFAQLTALAAVFIGGTPIARAADAPLLSLDPSFAPLVTVEDQNAVSPGSGDVQILTAANQPDGKIVIGGHFHLVQGTARRGLARLNADGSLDASFNPGFGVRHSADVEAVALQPDGKVVAAGSFSRVNLQRRPLIARFLTNGVVDEAYAPAISGSAAHAVAVTSDSKVYLGGAFAYTNNAVARDGLVRLMPDGAIDRAFTLPEGYSFDVTRLVVQPGDGRLLVAGFIYGPVDQQIFNLVRLNTDGSIDTSFTSQASDLEEVRAVAVQTDGKIVLGGTFSSLNGRAVSYLARLTTRGELDTTFKPELTDAVESLSIDSKGRILVGGKFNLISKQTRNRVVRLNADGTLDKTFDPGAGPAMAADSRINTPAVPVVLPQSAGGVLVAGSFALFATNSNPCTARLDEAGGLDPKWKKPTLAAASIIYTVARQADGKLLIGGEFTHVNGVRQPAIARLLADGSLDRSFAAPLQPWTNAPNILRPLVSAIAVQPDGAIVVGGTFFVRETGGYAAVKLRPNGTVDTSFSTVLEPMTYLSAISRQTDGTLILGGSLVINSTTFGILRVNPDGTLDRSYRQVALDGAQFDPPILSMVSRPDGKLYISGSFQQVGGVARKNVARLHSDGSVDGAFDTSQGAVMADTTGGDNALVSALRVQADGKVVIGGFFERIRGVAQTNLARLNIDGSLDGSFRPQLDADVVSMDIGLDGRVAIAGAFTTVNSQVRNGLALVRSDGTTDSGLTGGANDDLLVAYTLLFTPTGELLVAGDYSVVAGQSRYSFSRFTPAVPPSPPKWSINRAGTSVQLMISGSVGSSVIVDISDDMKTWRPLTTLPITSDAATVVESSGTAVPARFYRARLAP